MIRYLKHQEISKAKWDESIRNSPNGLIYAYSWYLDIVCPKWEALVEDDYISIMPLPMKKKYGYTYTYTPPFSQQLGLFSLYEIPEGKIMEFISAIPSHYRYIEMSLNEKNILISESLEIKKQITHILDLTRPYTEIAAGYSTQTKRNLKKARSCSLTVVQSVLREKTIKLFSANRGMRYGFSAEYYIMLEQLIDTLSLKKSVISMGVNDKKNAFCAGAFFIKSKDRDIFLFSGANEIAYDSQAMTLLINSYIEEHAGAPVLFDFEGSMDGDLARFYSGFGSKKIEFLKIRKNMLPTPVKWIKEIQFKRKSAIAT